MYVFFSFICTNLKVIAPTNITNQHYSHSSTLDKNLYLKIGLLSPLKNYLTYLSFMFILIIPKMVFQLLGGEGQEWSDGGKDACPMQ
jgi:hypothetical protein